MPDETIRTPITDLLGIRYPVLLAGMFGVAHAELVAAVSNAGGMGTIGGLTLTPKILKKEISMVKALLKDKNAPFGVDLAIPQLGGSARKTNYDYTHGHLPELVDIMIKERVSLFVCAVGVPPKWLIDKLHAAGIPVMNMVGHPKHVKKALNAGVDIICAQGSEGGGHTGDIATTVLIPQCVDICRGQKSPLYGGPIHVLAGGGIYDGRGLAAALSLGAAGVWVGTRFVASVESSGSPLHKKTVLAATSADTVRSLIYSGRPVRCFVSDYVKDWEENRADEIRSLVSKGVVPYMHDMQEKKKAGQPLSIAKTYPLLMGQAAGPINEIKPAKVIIDDMVTEAIAILKANVTLISPSDGEWIKSKL